MKILGREFKFGDPARANIVIFDETNSRFVRKAVSPTHSVAVFKVRPEELRVGPRVAINFVRFLRQLQLRDAKAHTGGIFRGVLSQLRCIYLEACLAAMKPYAVVTFIDNSAPFSWLSRYCRQFPFFAIQNGSRLSYVAEENYNYYLQHLFCFGEHEINLFPKIGYHVENFYPVGSLHASLHFSHPQPTSSADKYDLLVVSTWRGNIGYQQDVRDTMRSMRIMDCLLAQYIRSRGIRAAVILRAERNGPHWTMPEVGLNEEEYFCEAYRGCIEIIDTDFSVSNVFPLMEESHTIVSCLSTALLEAFGIGKRILYCNFTGTAQYHRDLDPSIVSTDDSPEGLYARLDEIRTMPEAEYSRRYRSLAKYYMNYPDGMPSYRKIAEIVDKVLRQAVTTG